MRVREGWARAVEPALLASEGTDAENEPASSERRAWMPEASVRATRHGLAPSFDDGERGMGGLVVNGWR